MVCVCVCCACVCVCVLGACVKQRPLIIYNGVLTHSPSPGWVGSLGLIISDLETMQPLQPATSSHQGYPAWHQDDQHLLQTSLDCCRCPIGDVYIKQLSWSPHKEQLEGLTINNLTCTNRCYDTWGLFHSNLRGGFWEKNMEWSVAGKYRSSNNLPLAKCLRRKTS